MTAAHDEVLAALVRARARAGGERAASDKKRRPTVRAAIERARLTQLVRQRHLTADEARQLLALHLLAERIPR